MLNALSAGESRPQGELVKGSPPLRKHKEQIKEAPHPLSISKPLRCEECGSVVESSPGTREEREKERQR